MPSNVMLKILGAHNVSEFVYADYCVNSHFYK